MDDFLDRPERPLRPQHVNMCPSCNGPVRTDSEFLIADDRAAANLFAENVELRFIVSRFWQILRENGWYEHLAATVPGLLERIRAVRGIEFNPDGPWWRVLRLKKERGKLVRRNHSLADRLAKARQSVREWKARHQSLVRSSSDHIARACAREQDADDRADKAESNSCGHAPRVSRLGNRDGQQVMEMVCSACGDVAQTVRLSNSAMGKLIG